MMQGWYYVESLTGQRHDRVQTESQIATVDSCFDLVMFKKLIAAE